MHLICYHDFAITDTLQNFLSQRHLMLQQMAAQLDLAEHEHQQYQNTAHKEEAGVAEGAAAANSTQVSR